MKIPIVLRDGKIEMSEFHKGKVREALRDANGPIRAEIHTLLPESRKMRAYVMGGLIPLATYMDGHDHTDSEICGWYFEHFKKEFTPHAIKIDGKIQVFGKSSKGSNSLKVFAEKLQDHLAEQHGIEYSSKAVSPVEYKRFRDEIYPFQMEYKDYIDYCEKMKWIRKP